MQGVILAGGKGSRLLPLTNIVNKFLLPVYNKPLIEYSIESLVKANIHEIIIVLGNKSAGDTIEYLKSGKKYNCHFTYVYQEHPLGVANALYCVKNLIRDNIVVMCADNIILDDISKFINNFKSGCFISCKTFNNDDLKRFAVAKIINNKIVCFEEKPRIPGSNIAFAGIQIYDNNVFNIIDTLKPSNRNEYEITDVINNYIKNNNFSYDLLKEDCIDAGTPDSLLEAQNKIFHLLNK